MRAAWHHANAIHYPRWQHACVQRRVQIVHNFFHRHDHFFRCQRRFFLYSNNPVNQHIAFAVRLLRMQDAHIRTQRRSRRQNFAGERALNGFYFFIMLRQIGANVSAHHRERQPRRARLITRSHVRMAVFFDRERRRPAGVYRIAKAVQGTDARISAPGKYQSRSASHPDHLVVNQIRGHAHQREVAPPLANQLVPGGKRYQVRESFQRHGIAVVHQSRGRFAQ
jgi:hypothetical protein